MLHLFPVLSLPTWQKCLSAAHPQFCSFLKCFFLRYLSQKFIQMGPYINKTKKIKREKERADQAKAPMFWMESWQPLGAASDPVTTPLKTVGRKPLPHLAWVGFAVRPANELHSDSQKLEAKHCILKKSFWDIIPFFLPVSVLADLSFFSSRPL